jgi:hypothetical protein
VTEDKETDWNCTNISPTNITIKMDYFDPYEVSQSSAAFSDLLKIKFTKRYFYLSTVEN